MFLTQSFLAAASSWALQLHRSRRPGGGELGLGFPLGFGNRGLGFRGLGFRGLGI